MSLHISNFFKGLLEANKSGALVSSFTNLDNTANEILAVLPDSPQKTLALSSLQTAANLLHAVAPQAVAPVAAPVVPTAPQS